VDTAEALEQTTVDGVAGSIVVLASLLALASGVAGRMNATPED